MTDTTKALEEFNRYFISGNNVAPNARISVPTAEWQALHAQLHAALAGAVEPVEAKAQPMAGEWVRGWADYWRKRALSAESAQGPAVKCGQCGNTEVFFYARLDELKTEATTGAPLSTQAAPVAGWQPIETAPKSGEFLIGAWEGDWANPRARFRIYHATGYMQGPSWAMKGNYRTEEGGAYELAGWMDAPKPSTEGQS